MLHQTKAEAPAPLPEAAAIQIPTTSFPSPILNVTYAKHQDIRTEHIACLMLILTCLSRRIYNTWPTSMVNQTRRSSWTLTRAATTITSRAMVSRRSFRPVISNTRRSRLLMKDMGSDPIVRTSLHINKRLITSLETSKGEEKRQSKVDGKVCSEGLCCVLIRNTNKTTLTLSLSRSRQEYSAASWPNAEVQILKIELIFRLSNSCRWARANSLWNQATRNPGTAQWGNSSIHRQSRSSKSSWWSKIPTVQHRSFVQVPVSTGQASKINQYNMNPPSWTWQLRHQVWAQEVFVVFTSQISLEEASRLVCSRKIHMANLRNYQTEMESFS